MDRRMLRALVLWRNQKEEPKPNFTTTPQLLPTPPISLSSRNHCPWKTKQDQVGTRPLCWEVTERNARDAGCLPSGTSCLPTHTGLPVSPAHIAFAIQLLDLLHSDLCDISNTLAFLPFSQISDTES